MQKKYRHVGILRHSYRQRVPTAHFVGAITTLPGAVTVLLDGVTASVKTRQESLACVTVERRYNKHKTPSMLSNIECVTLKTTNPLQ